MKNYDKNNSLSAYVLLRSLIIKQANKFLKTITIKFSLAENVIKKVDYVNTI